MITRTFKLCLNAGTGSAPFINVSQTDKDEVWLFELYTETGERYIPSSGAIIGIKSDGHGIANTGTVDSEGRVVITETEQMTAAAGRSIFELSIDGLTHGTANFIVNVEKKPIDGAIMSDSDLSLISQAVDSAAVIVDVIGDGDPSEVIGEHVDAWLDNHPEATTTVLDGAITAPKINNSLWDKLLVSEEASGAVASFDDGADDVPVSSLKVALEPIQTGTGDPSPSNIRPIYPANGKNLFNESLFDTHVTVLTYQSFAIPNGVYTMSSDFLLVNSTSNVFFLAGQVTSGAATVYNGVYANHPITVTVTDGYYTVAYRSTYTDNPNDPKDFHFQIERGSSVSPYQPYQGIMVERTGKNLWALADEFTSTASGQWVLTDTAMALKAGAYTVSFDTSVTGNGSVLFNFKTPSRTNGVTVSTAGTATRVSATFTIDEDLTAVAICIYGTAKTIRNIQIEIGSTATTYEPYTGTSYPYSLGQSVYGGSVDLATGVLTVDRAYNQMTYTYLSGLSSSYIGASSTVYSDSGAIWVRNWHYSTAKTRHMGGIKAVCNAYIISMHDTNINSSQNRIYFKVPTGTTVADFLTQVQTLETNGYGLWIAYELENPTTAQLTPTQVKTLLGYNNISSTGTVDVIYHADTKLYVDKMTNVDNAIIAPTEADFVATRNYTVNDLVIVADTLYKVTANIASGSAITPNSNVQQTTLGALIKALS